jgi:hypothetical protein
MSYFFGFRFFWGGYWRILRNIFEAAFDRRVSTLSLASIVKGAAWALPRSLENNAFFAKVRAFLLAT